MARGPIERRQRQTAAQALAEHHEIGLQTLVLEAMQLAASRQTRP